MKIFLLVLSSFIVFFLCQSLTVKCRPASNSGFSCHSPECWDYRYAPLCLVALSSFWHCLPFPWASLSENIIIIALMAIESWGTHWAQTKVGDRLLFLGRCWDVDLSQWKVEMKNKKGSNTWTKPWKCCLVWPLKLTDVSQLVQGYTAAEYQTGAELWLRSVDTETKLRLNSFLNPHSKWQDWYFNSVVSAIAQFFPSTCSVVELRARSGSTGEENSFCCLGLCCLR